MNCQHCGNEVNADVPFCDSCGTFLGKLNRLTLESLKLAFMRADLAGFTSMSESLTSEDVMTFLNEVFGVFSRVIESYKGVIYEVIGDEIVSVFGFPKESGFTPHMAVFAAEDLLKKLDALNRKRYLKNPVGLKIGMTMDHASLPSVHRDLRQAVIITQGFRKCQILQKNAADNTVLVDENLYQATKAFFTYTKVGDIEQDSFSIKAYEYKVKTQ
jgi:adenylate cyclase